MKKILVSVITVLLLMSIAVTAFAVTDLPRLDDSALLLTDSEAEDVTAALTAASSEAGIDIVVVTADGNDGMGDEAFADDYYDYGGYAGDGVLLFVNMGDSTWHISTKGEAYGAFTEGGISALGEIIVPYMSDGDFYGAFMRFAAEVPVYMSAYRSGSPISSDYGVSDYAGDYADATADDMRTGGIVLSVVIGVVVGLIVAFALKKQLKSVAFKATANDYYREGTLNLKESRDYFLYRTVTRVPLPKDNNHGGGGHFSSSGSFHGGGGGRF